MSYMLPHPSHLQVDTFDYCNLNCAYCCFHNPSPKPTKMSMETVEKIASQLQGWPLASIRPFSRGDPLFNNDMPEIIRIFRKYTHVPIVLFTNGTYYAGKHLLVSPDIGAVDFTISAATPETFQRVTGKPLFHEAIRTLEWFRDHKEPNQQITVRFVVNRLNEHELPAWRVLFKDYSQVPMLLHRHIMNSKMIDDLQASETVVRQLFTPMNRPCNLWSNMGINAHGDVIQCCGGDDVSTYGNVANTSLLEGWRKRCVNNLQNPVCQSCNYRAVD